MTPGCLTNKVFTPTRCGSQHQRYKQPLALGSDKNEGVVVSCKPFLFTRHRVGFGFGFGDFGLWATS